MIKPFSILTWVPSFLSDVSICEMSTKLAMSGMSDNKKMCYILQLTSHYQQIGMIFFNIKTGSFVLGSILIKAEMISVDNKGRGSYKSNRNALLRVLTLSLPFQVGRNNIGSETSGVTTRSLSERLISCSELLSV